MSIKQLIAKGSFLNNPDDYLGIRPFVAHPKYQHNFGVRPKYYKIGILIAVLCLLISSIGAWIWLNNPPEIPETMLQESTNAVDFRLSATTTADLHAGVEEKVSVDLTINPHYATVNGMDMAINFSPADLQLTGIEDLSRMDFPNSALVFIPDLPSAVQTATSQGIIKLSALQDVSQPSGLTGDEGYFLRLLFVRQSAASTKISIDRESTVVAVSKSNKNALGELVNLQISALAGPTTPVQVSIPPSISPTPKPSCSPIACALYCANGFVKDANGCDLCSCIPDPLCPVNQNGRPVCPTLSPVLCPYGNLVPRGKDRCGCPLPPRCKRCLGDVNHSGKVDYKDVLQVMRKFGRCKVRANCPEDLDQNGKVDRYDFKIVRRLVGTKCNMSPQPTPQPTQSPTPLPTQQPTPLPSDQPLD